MPSQRPRTAHLMATPDDVEAQFYEALRDDDIVCVHPGGPRVVGTAAIRASFEAIFERGGIPVHPDQVRRTRSLDAAVHNLVEVVSIASAEGTQQAYVVATNVYLKTTLGWRLVAHHASPGSATAPQDHSDPPTTLH